MNKQKIALIIVGVVAIISLGFSSIALVTINNLNTTVSKNQTALNEVVQFLNNAIAAQQQQSTQ